MSGRAAPVVCGLALIVALTVAACGGSGNDASPAAPETLSDSSAAEPADTAGSSPADPTPSEPAAVSEGIEPAEPGASVSEASCELETVPSQVPLEGGQTHFEALPHGFAYNSVPASQGPHHPKWLTWGVYEQPVPELNVVHNLEHGGITVQYGRAVPPETIAAVLAWYDEDSDAIIVAPHDALGSEIALAGWTVEDIDQGVEALYSSSEGNVLHCDGFDERAFSEFRENYRGKAPERIPLERLPAGS